MRRLDLLITQSRRDTENVEFTDESGIADDQIIQYANDGQDSIQTIIQSEFPNVFQNEVIIDLVPLQEAYDIPSDAFLGTRVDTVEYSSSGNAQDYYPLFKGSGIERLAGRAGNPEFFIRRNKQILIQPIPQGRGNIRVVYQKQLPKLDIRRAQVSAVTITSQVLTSLTLDPTQLIQDSELLEENYISVVNKNGVITAKNIPITAINTTTGDVTLDGSVTLEDGETIAVNSYVVRGKEATTHSQLPDICEKYLLNYMNLRCQMKDSSVDAQDMASLLQQITEEIKIAFAEPDGAVNYVPLSDLTYITGYIR